MGFIDSVKRVFGMEEEDKDLVTLIAEGSINKAKAKFSNRAEIVKTAIEQYNIATHAIMDRPNKTLLKGDIITSWNLPISYQKKIVQSAVAFLYGKPISIKQESQGTDRAFKMLTDLRKEMRMSAKDQKTAELMKSETECAKLFVPYRDANAAKDDLTTFNSLKCILLAKSLGDTIHVSFDNFGVLRAVGREYKVKVNNKEVEHFDIYMADKIYYCQKNLLGWDIKDEINIIGKIPIIWYMQIESEWYDVQKLIERREYLTSARADNNDRSGDPILLIEGDPVSLPAAKEAGKVIVLKQGSKASYLVPQMSVDMVANEKEDLKELIHYLTDTPDLSMDKMTSMGLTSGKAIEMAFFGCLLKAMGQHGYYEEMHDREFEVIRAFMYKVIDTTIETEAKNLSISFEFGNPLPDNVEDLINMLSTAVGGKSIMSVKTAIAKNPLVTNADDELKALSAEAIDGSEE